MIRIGFDLGGSKLAAIALDAQGRELARSRDPVPAGYAAILAAILDTTRAFERAHGRATSVGVGMPGMITRGGELVRVVNLPWLEGRPLGDDLEHALGRPVRLGNDANCFALSEATDGAAAGAALVFGVILGTGVGGGIVVDGCALTGANAIAGEWGHNPLPLVESEQAEEAPVCGCGRRGCIEAWLNGAALTRNFRRMSGRDADPAAIAKLAQEGDASALKALELYERRLARALAGIINLLDPDCIVVGGGLSAITHLYGNIPRLWRDLVLAPEPQTRFVRARFGPESGLRGAAWLGAAPQKNVPPPSAAGEPASPER